MPMSTGDLRKGRFVALVDRRTGFGYGVSHVRRRSRLLYPDQFKRLRNLIGVTAIPQCLWGPQLAKRGPYLTQCKSRCYDSHFSVSPTREGYERARLHALFEDSTDDSNRPGKRKVVVA